MIAVILSHIRIMMIFIDDNERQLYLSIRGQIKQEYCFEKKLNDVVVENHWGKTMTKDAKQRIKLLREENEMLKIDIRDLIGGL